MTLSTETTLVHAGSAPERQAGYVSPPVYRGSTVLYPSLEEMRNGALDPLKLRDRVYGRFGTPTSRDFETALAELEGGFGSVCTGTGLAALTTTVLAFAKAGAHILVSDSVYLPMRKFCDSLARFNVRVEYFNPGIGAIIETLFRPETRLVVLESPGSMTFEVHDIRAISTACRAQGVVSMIDNTWATPVYLKPLTLGVNISVHSATKYITGHADGFLGVIVCDEATYATVRATAMELGQKAGADDVHLALRGLRTLHVRLKQHFENGLALAHWLEARSEVANVCHPALASHPQHQLWRRDFAGACGLFTFQFKETYSLDSINAFANALRLFGLGHSWGGFESLLAPVQISPKRKFTPLGLDSARAFRLHVGLENREDLKSDLARAFTELRS